MLANLEITEVIRRVEQGVTRPFLCRASDGQQYYVKSPDSAGREALCREWLGARIAEALELPIPNFKRLWVSDELLEGLLTPDHRPLGCGDVFGSQQVMNHQEVTVLDDLSSFAPDKSARILLFDWWIQNADRSLTDAGGNANLIWARDHKVLHVIDHNNAFDHRFNPETFWQTHIFRAHRQQWDRQFRQDMTHQMSLIIEKLDQFWSELPETWTYLDQDMGIPVELQLKNILSMLRRMQTASEAFWGGRA